MDVTQLPIDDDSIIEFLLRQHYEAMESENGSSDSPPDSQQSSTKTIEGQTPIASYLGQLLVAATGPTWGPETNEEGFRDSQLAFRRRLEARVKQIMPVSLESKFDTEDILQSAFKDLLRGHVNVSNHMKPGTSMNDVRGVVYNAVEYKAMKLLRYYRAGIRNISREISSDEGCPMHATDNSKLPDDEVVEKLSKDEVVKEVVETMRNILQQTHKKKQPIFNERVRRVLVLSTLGMHEDEIAAILSVSSRTIRRDKEIYKNAFGQYKNMG